uniref:Terminase small subunit n=1 Tax=Myoviridae sp. cthAo37 TaxID=2827701 RepID=A0A8S5S4N7_9CAUD|nr:MAG TPA: terminase small subunit [Myoviridae sp. cthAo37]
MVNHYARATPTTRQGKLIEKAMEQAVKETAKYGNYRDRLQAIELLFFEGYSVPKVSMILSFSERTIQRWKIDFVNAVGKNAGF